MPCLSWTSPSPCLSFQASCKEYRGLKRPSRLAVPKSSSEGMMAMTMTVGFRGGGLSPARFCDPWDF